MTDIWQTVSDHREAESDIEDSKRHLIGNVVKASDGSIQLFSDLKSHIGTNKIGCCGRSFVASDLKRNPVESSSSVADKTKKISALKWKSVVQKVKTSETFPKQRKNINDKTYSTYALDHKFRNVYTSLRIGIRDKKEENKAKKTQITIELQPEKIMGKKGRHVWSSLPHFAREINIIYLFSSFLIHIASLLLDPHLQVLGTIFPLNSLGK